VIATTTAECHRFHRMTGGAAPNEGLSSTVAITDLW
jgi:hypothetical protein